jgi:hypothetical protein
MSEIGIRGVPSHHPMRIEVIYDFAYRVFYHVYPGIPLLVELWDNEIFEFVVEIR